MTDQLHNIEKRLTYALEQGSPAMTLTMVMEIRDELRSARKQQQMVRTQKHDCLENEVVHVDGNNAWGSCGICGEVTNA